MRWRCFGVGPDVPVLTDDELGTVQELGSGQVGLGKIGAIEHRFEKVRAIQVGARQVRLG
jgi:hypothetical protein